MNPEEKFDVILVGGSLSAATCAEALRIEGFKGSICVVSGENAYPYNRPPLSKQVLTGKWESAQAFIYDADKYRELQIEFLFGQMATGLNISEKKLEVGEVTLVFDKLVIATGISPRNLPRSLGDVEVPTLRTMQDANAIRDQMTSAKQAAVIGAGVLGCEIASSLHASGINTVVIEQLPAPQIPHTAGLISEIVRNQFQKNGISLICGVEVESITGLDGKTEVTLSNGDTLEVDMLVAAIGSVPNTDWLVDSGLPLENGVLCDELGRVTSDIYAIGDVARWHDPLTKKSIRRENQSSAIDQALIVAKHIVNRVKTAVAPSFFWSEILGNRILLIGELVSGKDAEVRVLAGEFPSEKFIIGTERDGDFSGILSWNMPREFREFRKTFGG